MVYTFREKAPITVSVGVHSHVSSASALLVYGTKRVVRTLVFDVLSIAETTTPEDPCPMGFITSYLRSNSNTVPAAFTTLRVPRR